MQGGILLTDAVLAFRRTCALPELPCTAGACGPAGPQERSPGQRQPALLPEPAARPDPAKPDIKEFHQTLVRKPNAAGAGWRVLSKLGFLPADSPHAGAALCVPFSLHHA